MDLLPLRSDHVSGPTPIPGRKFRPMSMCIHNVTLAVPILKLRVEAFVGLPDAPSRDL